MKLKSATLHDVMFIAGIGQIKPVITSQTCPGCVMALNDSHSAVFLEFKGVKAIIPLSNFKVVVADGA